MDNDKEVVRMKRTHWIILLSVALLAAALPVFAQTATPTPTIGLVELKGPIEAVGSGTITIGGQIINVSGAFLDDDVRLVAGATVEVHLQTTPVNGVWIALSVDNERDPAATPFAEIKGTLDSMDGSIIVVSGAVIDTSSAAIADALGVGMPVEVYAQPGSAGVWLATRVEENFRDRSRDRDRQGDGGGSDESGRDRDRDRDRFFLDEDFEIVGTVEQAGANFLVVNGQRISIVAGVTDLDPFVVGNRVAVEIGMVNGAAVAFEVNNLRDDDRLDDRGGQRRGSDDDRGSSRGSGRGSDDSGGSGGSGGSSDDRGGSGGSDESSDDRGGSGGSGGSSDGSDGSSDDSGGSDGSDGSSDDSGGSGGSDGSSDDSGGSDDDDD
jgi:hypothetical protein